MEPWAYEETRVAGCSGRRAALTYGLMAAVGVALFGTGLVVAGAVLIPVAFVLVVIAAASTWGWTTTRRLGLAVGRGELRIGDVGYGDRREAAGRSAWPDRQSELSLRRLWAVRLEAVRGAVVVEGGDYRELARLQTVPAPQGRARVRRLGFHASRFAPAHLLLVVDPGGVGVRVPALKGRTFRGYTTVRTESLASQGNLWAVPTRQPAQVRELLADLGLPTMDAPAPDPPLLVLTPPR